MEVPFKCVPTKNRLAGHLPLCQTTLECRLISMCMKRGFWDRQCAIKYRTDVPPILSSDLV
jgi:hypothetical protein